jgi:hypothetical protein
MVASLPVTAWLLLIATVVLPLTIELVYLSIRRTARERRPRTDARSPDGGRGG